MDIGDVIVHCCGVGKISEATKIAIAGKVVDVFKVDVIGLEKDKLKTNKLVVYIPVSGTSATIDKQYRPVIDKPTAVVAVQSILCGAVKDKVRFEWNKSSNIARETKALIQFDELLSLFLSLYKKDRTNFEDDIFKLVADKLIPELSIVTGTPVASLVQRVRAQNTVFVEQRQDGRYDAHSVFNREAC